MELLNDLVQGSEIWLEARRKHFTASDAPAVMGASKYKTRKQLLDEKSGGATEVITPAKQKLFDKGHKAEDDARNVLAVEEMDEYLPCVGVVETCIYGLPLMASFDGRSDNEDHLFEHKLWNETLAENVRNNTLASSHYWQLEHQLLVDESAEYVLFVVSDGTANKREMMKYYPVDGRAEELIAAWALFQDDLEGHQIEAKQEVVIAESKTLPVIQCSVTGSQITTNISNCLVEVQKLAKSEMERSFETDQDFADKDQLNKDVKKAREELKSRVADIKSEFVSYSEFEAIALDMDKVLQQMQSHGEKQVKQAKEVKKTFLKNEAHAALQAHINDCNAIIKASFGIESVVNIVPNWSGAMKNKRTIASIEDALDTELNNWKVQLTAAAEVIAPNFKFLQENANDYKFLFTDVFAIINQPSESFNAIVKTRVNDHKEKEAEKLAIETARIKKEADDEAARKIEAGKEAIRQQERDKVNAENQAIAEQVATAENLEAENYANAELEKSLPGGGVGYPVKGTDPAFNGVRNSSPSQLQKNINAIEAQSTHKQPHKDFIEWQRKHQVNSVAFLELEILLNKHFS